MIQLHQVHLTLTRKHLQIVIIKLWVLQQETFAQNQNIILVLPSDTLILYLAMTCIVFVWTESK